MQHSGFENEPTEIAPRRGRLLSKLFGAIITSKRVGASLAAILVGIFGQYGLDESLAMAIQATLMSWIVSDSIRPTENIFASRRFWLVVCSIGATVAGKYGLDVTPETLMSIVIPIIGWILGDGIRETLSGHAKFLQLRAKS